MATSKIIMLQKVVNLITADHAFCDRWAIATFLEKAVNTRYKFENITVTTAIITKALSRLEPNIQDLSYTHNSGVYSGMLNHNLYFFFQDGNIQYPYFPPPRNQSQWDKMRDVDFIKLEEYINRVTLS